MEKINKIEHHPIIIIRLIIYQFVYRCMVSLVILGNDVINIQKRIEKHILRKRMIGTKMNNMLLELSIFEFFLLQNLINYYL